MTPKCPKCGMYLNSVDGEPHECEEKYVEFTAAEWRDLFLKENTKYFNLIKRIKDRIAAWQERIDKLADMPAYYSGPPFEIALLKQKQEELESLLEEEKK